MSFLMLVKDLKGRLMEAASEYPEVDFSILEPPSGFGDLSSNLPMLLSKETGSKPYELAKRIGSKLRVEGSQIGRVEAHPSGYLNFWIDYGRFSKSVIDRAVKGLKLDWGEGKRVLVEHTSLNPAHQLHIGHLRNVILGDTIYRVLKFLGYEVHVHNYIDDLGLQVGDVLLGIRKLGADLEEREEKFDHYIGRIYVKINELYMKDKDLLEERKEVLKELERLSEEFEFSRRIVDRVVMEQLKTSWRVGARYDCINYESHVLASRMWKEIFERIKEKGIAILSKEGRLKGCWYVRVEGEKEGEEKVLVRSDGTTTYIAKDIPYAAWKLGLLEDRFKYVRVVNQPDETTLWSTTLEDGEEEHPKFGACDIAINVIDVRQARLQRVIRYVLEGLVGEDLKDRYVHLDYEVVSLSGESAREMGIKTDRKIVHMSGRKGIFVSADDLLDSLFTKALAETRKRNQNADEGWIRSVAEKVGAAAVRYDMLKQDLDKMIVFDTKRALRLDGETGPYLQYTYARASSILKKAGEWIIPEILEFADEREFELVKEISKLDYALEKVSKSLSPVPLAKYGYRICLTFNSFYERLPVLKEREEVKKLSRLALVKALKETLRTCLKLMGIAPLERI